MKKETVDLFLERLEQMQKRTWIRQVIIPTLNDSCESARALFDLKEKYSCIEKIELLPFRKLCLEKYENMGLDFSLKDVDEASDELMSSLRVLEK
jgi:pyruvate formate lyase activating enzyme